VHLARAEGGQGRFCRVVGAEDEAINQVALSAFRSLAKDGRNTQLDAVNLPAGRGERLDLVGAGADRQIAG